MLCCAMLCYAVNLVRLCATDLQYPSMNISVSRNITEIGALINGTCVDAGSANLLNVTIFNSSGTERILDYYVEPVTEYWE